VSEHVDDPLHANREESRVPQFLASGANFVPAYWFGTANRCRLLRRRSKISTRGPKVWRRHHRIGLRGNFRDIDELQEHRISKPIPPELSISDRYPPADFNAPHGSHWGMRGPWHRAEQPPSYHLPHVALRNGNVRKNVFGRHCVGYHVVH